MLIDYGYGSGLRPNVMEGNYLGNQGLTSTISPQHVCDGKSSNKAFRIRKFNVLDQKIQCSGLEVIKVITTKGEGFDQKVKNTRAIKFSTLRQHGFNYLFKHSSLLSTLSPKNS